MACFLSLIKSMAIGLCIHMIMIVYVFVYVRYMYGCMYVCICMLCGYYCEVRLFLCIHVRMYVWVDILYDSYVCMTATSV